MSSDEAIERGREAFERQAWGDAYRQLTEADEASQLDVDGLELLAVTAQLIGKDDESARVWERAHQERLRRDDAARAARCAFWLGLHFMERGEMARAGGWLARARRILDERQLDCVEQGYLLIPECLQHLEGGDPAAALAKFDEVAAIGERFHDADLIALGRLGRGQSLVRVGQMAEGGTQLDEVMVAVVAGEVSPVVAGIVYCAVIEACQEMFDLRRAQEWTAALSDWCDSQPDLVAFRGRCLVYRAEIMQLRGAWQEATSEAQRAYERLSDPPGQPAVGAAYYRQGELYRLRGEFRRAGEAFRQSAEWGRRPEPGLALLRLAQGRVEDAEGAIRRALDEAEDRVTRSALLPAYVEIALAAEDAVAARTAADELAEIADGFGAPLLRAASAYVTGAVVLAEGDALTSVAVLRDAVAAWQALDAPYEAARARVLIACAARELADEETAEAETQAAREVFERLGAAPDLISLDAASGAAPAAETGSLTPRELQVLGLVATGMTNRSIAANLTISEKTVARHLSNIFGKLGLSSRAAATAYAYEHDLV